MFFVIKVSLDIDSGNESEEVLVQTADQNFANRVRDEANLEDQIPGHEHFAVTIESNN